MPLPHPPPPLCPPLSKLLQSLCKIASVDNQPKPVGNIPRVVEEVNSSPENVKHPWVTLRNRNWNPPMTDPDYGQQDTQTAHSQYLGRRDNYGGARPRVVEQRVVGQVVIE